MTAIEELWKELNSAEAPDGQYNGVDLAELSSTSQSVIGAFIDNGSLSDEQQAVLDENLTRMQSLNPKLSGDKQIFFGILYRACDLVQNQLQNTDTA